MLRLWEPARERFHPAVSNARGFFSLGGDIRQKALFSLGLSRSQKPGTYCDQHCWAVYVPVANCAPVESTEKEVHCVSDAWLVPATGVAVR